MGFRVIIDQRALIPRPETEILVEHALEYVKPMKNRPVTILDLGTGCGNIAISLAKSIAHSHVWAVDISQEALNVAKKNVLHHRLEGKITLLKHNMKEGLNGLNIIDQKFDMIISNPPYIKSSQMNQLPLDIQCEPHIALDGGKEGLDFYHYIFEISKTHLKDNGFLLCECGDGQAAAIEKIFSSASHFDNIIFKKDYTNINRIMVAQWKK